MIHVHIVALRVLFLTYRFVTLRDDHRIKAFETLVLRRIFGPNRLKC
jgi:hypothetical protein